MHKLSLPDGMCLPTECSPSLVEQVQSLIEKTESTGMRRTTAWAQIVELLKINQTAWVAPCNPEWVGTHHRNRSGAGVGGSEAQVHGEMILRTGFSFKKASDATAFQCPPSPWSAEAFEYNESQSNMSQGLIPRHTKLSLLSVGGSHTNTFLRQVNARVKSVVKELSDDTGHLNPEFLGVGQDAFKQALSQGLNWLQLHWVCPFVWPGLPSLAQNALNTDARGQQGEIEIMLYMFELMKQQLQSGNSVNWSHIETTAKQSLPPCGQYIGALSAYVRDNSGGIGGELLKQLLNFQKAFNCSEKGPLRTLGGEFLLKVAGLSFGPTEKKKPLFKNALLEANLQTDKVVDGISKLITPSMVAQASAKSKRPLLKQCEQVMSDARALCATIELPQHHATKFIGQLDVRVVGLFFGKGKDIEGVAFDNIDEISNAFLTDLKKGYTGSMELQMTAVATCDNETDQRGGLKRSNASFDLSEDAQKEKEEQKENEEDQMAPETVDQMKNLQFQASKQGFVMHAHVYQKTGNSGIVWQIVWIAATNVLCVQVTHKMAPRKITVTYDELLTSWALYKKKVAHKMEDMDSACPRLSAEWAIESARGMCLSISRRVYLEHAKNDELVSVWLNPTMVRANDEIAKGALVLAPASMMISRKPSNNCFRIHTVTFNDVDTKLFMTSYSSFNGEKKWVCPFWHIGTSTLKKDVNMSVSWKCVPGNRGCDAVSIMLLVNSRALKPGEALIRLKHSDFDDISVSERPAKKTKT